MPVKPFHESNSEGHTSGLVLAQHRCSVLAEAWWGLSLRDRMSHGRPEGVCPKETAVSAHCLGRERRPSGSVPSGVVLRQALGAGGRELSSLQSRG